MDYPKSVPNIGLVGGKFVDENTGTGQAGSLIPAVWGTAVTDEIINVIKDAGLLPKEGENNQLTAAIKEIIKKNAAAKGTKLEDYGITDAILSTPKTGVVGKISDIAKHHIGVYASGTTDSPPTSSGGLFLHMRYPGDTLAAFDIFGHVGGGADIFGFRRVLADGSFVNRTVYHDGNFDPATRVSIAASGWQGSAPVVTGAMSALSTSQLVSSVGGSTTDYPAGPSASNVGFHAVFSNSQFSGDLLIGVNNVAGKLVFRGNGPTAGLGVWRTVWHDGNFDPSTKINKDRSQAVGFFGGAKTAPYLLHEDGTFVYLQVDRPKDTALLTVNGWSKNADTGEITQRTEVSIGDSVGTMTVPVTWPFQFPTKCLRVSVSFRIATGSPIGLIPGFYDITTSGATMKLEELNSAVQSGLVCMVEAVGY